MCLRADWLPALSYQHSKLTNCSLIRLSLIFSPKEIRIFSSDKVEKFQTVRGGQTPVSFFSTGSPGAPLAGGSRRPHTPVYRRRGGGARSRPSHGGQASAIANPREGPVAGASAGAGERSRRAAGRGRQRPRPRGGAGGAPVAASRGGARRGQGASRSACLGRRTARQRGLTAYLQPDLPGAPVSHAAPRVVSWKRGQESFP